MRAFGQLRAVTPDPDTHDQLLAHLIHEHRRLPHEILGLPLDAVHQLEHFDDDAGLLVLGHRHDPAMGMARSRAS